MELFEGAMATFIVVFSLRCALHATTLIPAGTAPAIATKIGTAGARARSAPHPRSPAKIEINARCDNSFYRRHHICLSAHQVDQLFRLLLLFMLLGCASS